MAEARKLQYMPSSSSLTASTSSPSTSDVSPGLDSVLTISTAATSSMDHRHGRRPSLLGKFPKDFSSLLHPRISSRRTSTHYKTDQHAKGLLSDYADSDHPYDHTITTKTMYVAQDEDRQSRKQKSENRFYRFLTRSRSRSRTKTDSSNEPGAAFPEIAHNYTHNTSNPRQSSVSKQNDRGLDKHLPHTHSSFRPLSATTTATNTTITPGTPKARRITAPSPVVHSETAHQTEPTSQPSSPRSVSNTRRKLHNIFGIPLNAPRRSASTKGSASSTRPGTPDAHGPSVPPLPDYFVHRSSHDPISAPKKHKPPPPLKIQRSNSLSLTTRSKRDTLDFTESTSTTASSASKREFSRPLKVVNGMGTSSSMTAHISNNALAGSPSIPSSTSSLFDDRPHPPSYVGPSMSGPSKHRRTLTSQSDTSPRTPTSPHHRTFQPAAPQPLYPADGHTIDTAVPKIVQTPPTPQRPGSSPPRIKYRKNSLDSSHPRREMSVVDEERSIIDARGERGKSRIDELRSRQGHHSAIPKIKSVNIRSTRHGSFDFERPGWGVINASSRSTSNNSGSTAASGPNRSGESLSHASKGKSKDMPPPEVPKRRRSQRTQQASPIPPLTPDHTGASTSTTQSRSTSGGANVDGMVSSFGRKSGKRALGSGVARLVGIPHGTFSFEPPVPSPTMSTSTHGGECEREEEDRERERERERVRRRRQRLVDEHNLRPPNFAPMPTSLGFRSAQKGRSLDLGLGLSWVPSKVREDALMPSAMFPLDRRSQSASSRLGSSRNFVVEDDGREETKVGKDIAEKFRMALDPAGYDAFKSYVHQFDAQEIPFDGPTGIIARIERLMAKSSTLSEERKRRLIDTLVRIILQHV